MNIHDFQKMKTHQQKISMVTCYDYWSATIIAQTEIDCILVGDSLAMVMHGYSTTIPATVDLMVQHIEAVVRGAPHKFIIGDMPFCSYRKDLTSSMNAVEKIMQAGAQAIKLEGADGNIHLIDHIVKSGIPVMGHIGLTPQSVHALGGFKVQGKEKSQAERIKLQAKELEAAGCFAIVLECMPSEVAKEITEFLRIPTIGIGAGPDTSGQVLVLQDLLGLTQTIPKFSKKFLDGFDLIKSALNAFNGEVKTKIYPRIEEHTY